MKTQDRYFITEAEKRDQELRKRPMAWFVWLALVVCPPLGLWLLWRRKSSASVVTKALLTVIAISWMGVWVPLVVWLVMYLTALGDHMAYREYLRSLTGYIQSITR